MKAIDIHGMTNMELVRGETDEWYWATDYIHGDLYEAEELFRQGHPVRSNRLYLIHYPDGTVYEAVSSTNRSHFGSDLCFLPPFARRIFRCFRPALPAPILFWVKTGSSVRIRSYKQLTRTKDSDYSPLDYSLWEFSYALRISSGRSLGTMAEIASSLPSLIACS